MDPGDLQSLADACIHCGLCLDACPTYAELGSEPDSPRGRIYLMRALIDGRARPSPDITRHLDSCLGCRACEPACPSGVKYGRLLEGVRAHITEPARRGGLRSTLWRYVIRKVLPYRERFGLLTRPLRLLGRVPRARLPAFLRRHVDSLGPFPTPIPMPGPATGAATVPATGQTKASFLAGCAMPVLFPEVNAATVRLLAEAGYDVAVPEAAGCCGALQAHDGDARGAVERAAALVPHFADCDLIVTNAAGCGAAMKAYPNHLAPKVRDLSEALLEAGWQPRTTAMAQTVAYHDPCHLAHGQGIREAPRELLRRRGARLVEVEEADYCCGGAGTYTLLQPELSDRLLARKIRHLLAAAPDLIVSANPSCLMQIRRGLLEAGSTLPVRHLAEVLVEAQSPSSATPTETSTDERVSAAGESWRLRS